VIKMPQAPNKPGAVLVDKYASRDVIFAADLASRLVRKPVQQTDLATLTNFCEKLLDEMSTVDLYDKIWKQFTQLRTDTVLFNTFAQKVYHVTNAVGECTYEIMQQITLHPQSFLPQQRCTRLLFDSLRKSRYKAHVVPLHKLATRDMRTWAWQIPSNLKLKFKSAADVRANVFFRKLVRTPDAQVDLSQWLYNCMERAHKNIVSLVCGGSSDATAPYKYTGLQLQLFRVNVIQQLDNRADIEAVLSSVFYRTRMVILPFSECAGTQARASGFGGTLYYQYEVRDSGRRSATTRTASNARRERKYYWGVIGGRKFWKHWRALPSATRTFTIRTAPGLTEQQQMQHYVRLLGMHENDARLGRLLYAVAFQTVAAHNMGMLRTFYSYLESLPDDVADGGVAGGAGKTMAYYFSFDPVSFLLSETAETKLLRNYRHSRVIRHKPDGDGKCSHKQTAMQRGAVENFDEGGFETRVERSGKHRCIGTDHTTSPLWEDISTMNAILAANADDRVHPTIKSTALRMLLAEWNRRSYAIVRKKYVRCGHFFLDADNKLTKAAACPASGDLLTPSPLKAKTRNKHLGELVANTARVASQADMITKFKAFAERVRRAARGAGDDEDGDEDED
jgi:hypothetical protein